jgi:DNA-binding MarR family transcriptional regulator
METQQREPPIGDRGSRVAGRKDNARAYRVDEHIPFLMNCTAAAMFMGFSADFPSGLTVPMWRILSVLYEKGSQRQVDLARLIAIEESTASRTITALTKKGLVARRRSANNSREVAVSLSARGKGVVERLIPMVREHQRVITEGLRPLDVRALRRCLVRMRANMELYQARSDARRPACSWSIVAPHVSGTRKPTRSRRSAG